MTRKEVADIAVTWAKEQGWNPGLNDADCFYEVDPGGFFAGELNGEVISCISAVRYDEKFGFMGFYIVKPQYRGKGFGLEIFNKALEYMGGRVVGGDGVLERIEDYKKIGFNPAYRNRRYQGHGTGNKTISKNLEDITKIEFEKLCGYDDAVFGAKRHSFLKRWISQPNAKGYAYLDNEKISGYGFIRPCFKGYKIGPLFADNAFIAEAILNALLGYVPLGEEVFLDVPEVNIPAVDIAQNNKMNIVFSTMRIYLNGVFHTPLKKIFGITSFELG